MVPHHRPAMRAESFIKGECKTMLSDDLGERKNFTKGLEFLHVVFNVIEKCGPVFLSLVFALFSS